MFNHWSFRLTYNICIAELFEACPHQSRKCRPCKSHKEGKSTFPDNKNEKPTTAGLSHSKQRKEPAGDGVEITPRPVVPSEPLVHCPEFVDG